MNVDLSYDSLFVPEEERLVSIQRHEFDWLVGFVLENRFAATLEIGFAYGFSAVAIAGALRRPHLVIDPYQDDAYFGMGHHNVESVGMARLVEHRSAPSHVVLPRLLADGRSFDLVFIDGDVRFENLVVDWFYTDRLLRQGGCVIIRRWAPSCSTLATFIRSNRADYRQLDGPAEMAVFEKTGNDERAVDHFVPFEVAAS